MTEINFYVSKEEGLEQRFAIVHRLVNIALQKKLSIHIHTDAESTSIKLDDFLWTKDKTSFIPHSVISDSNNLETNQDSSKKTPNKQVADKIEYEINISHEYEPLTHCDYLINLSNQLPAFFSRFLKVAEILDNNEEIITAGRKRYSFYRDRGYTLGYHQL